MLSDACLDALAAAGLLPAGVAAPPPPAPLPDDAPGDFFTDLAPWQTTRFRRRHVPTEDEEAALASMAVRDAASEAAVAAAGGLEGTWRTLPRRAPDGRPWTVLTFYRTLVAHKTAAELQLESTYAQLSAEWFAARDFICTASAVYGGVLRKPGVLAVLAAYGYTSDDQLGAVYSNVASCVEKKLTPFTSSDAPRWGRLHEKHANECFQDWIRERVRRLYVASGADVSGATVEFFYPGVYRFVEAPYIGVSVDCLFTYTHPSTGEVVCNLTEYKSGYYKRHAASHPYAKYPHNIPPYYLAQCLLQMIVLHAFHPTWKPTHCWFGVWQPAQMWVTSVPLPAAAERATWLAAVQAFYFDDLLPAMVRKANGDVYDGTRTPTHIDLDAGTTAPVSGVRRSRSDSLLPPQVSPPLRPPHAARAVDSDSQWG